MIAYVNGYVCTTPCEAAAARAGRDPFAPPGTPPGQSGKSDTIARARVSMASRRLCFGGALANLSPTNAVTPSGNTSPASQPSLNVLA